MTEIEKQATQQFESALKYEISCAVAALMVIVRSIGADGKHPTNLFRIVDHRGRKEEVTLEQILNELDCLIFAASREAYVKLRLDQMAAKVAQEIILAEQKNKEGTNESNQTQSN